MYISVCECSGFASHLFSGVEKRFWDRLLLTCSFLLGVRPSRDGWGGHRPAEEWLFGYSKWGIPQGIF